MTPDRNNRIPPGFVGQIDDFMVLTEVRTWSSEAALYRVRKIGCFDECLLLVVSPEARKHIDTHVSVLSAVLLDGPRIVIPVPGGGTNLSFTPPSGSELFAVPVEEQQKVLDLVGASQGQHVSGGDIPEQGDVRADPGPHLLQGV